MKYGIIDKQTNKFLIISDNQAVLRETVAKHMPQFCADDIKEYADSDIECSFDGVYYLRNALLEKIEPTAEDVRNLRRQYRSENCDDLTLEKVRKTALGFWTDEDEAAYVEKMQKIENYIVQHMPYSGHESPNGGNSDLVIPNAGVDV